MTTEINAIEKKDSNSQFEKKKKKFKMPGAIAIIVGVVIFVAILSWIPHASGKATALQLFNEDGSVYASYESGSLGAWQNWILYNTLNTDIAFADSQLWVPLINADAPNLVVEYGLEGDWVDGVGFVTNVSTTWPISAYADGTTSQFGLFDTFKAMLGGYQDAAGLALYLVGIYSIVLLLIETETLKDGVSSLVKGMGGRELLLVPILFTFFSLGGTLFGMQEETLGLLPVIVPVLILAGFDAMTGMLVVVVGCTTGIASSVLDPFSIGVMAEGLSSNTMDVTIGTGIIERMILFVIYTSMGASFCTWYAVRVRKNPEKSGEADKYEENKKWAEDSIGDISELKSMNRKQKFSMWLFAFVFLVMILTLMPWTTWFPTLGESAGWIWFSHIFYGNVLIGEWYFVELGILFMITAFIIAKVFEMSTSKIALTYWNALKDMFGVISIIAFSRAISAIMTTSGLTYGMIYGMGADNLNGDHSIVFSLIWLFIFTLMAIFIPSTSGLAGATAPIAGGVVGAMNSGQEILMVGIMLVYPLAQGCVNMFSPTGTAVIQCNQSKVTYSKAFPWLIGYAFSLLIVGAILISIILGVENALGVYETPTTEALSLLLA